MADVTSKMLHEKTGRILDRVRRGERIRIIRDGKPEAHLIPAEESKDPEWSEIMAEIWALQKTCEPTRPNPVLEGRKKRDYAARLR